LSETAAANAWNDGRAMPLEKAVEEVLITEAADSPG
jgi:hypothetical protein